MSFDSIVIANIGEFNRRSMTACFTSGEVASWDLASLDLSDMALFWCGDNKLVVLPQPPDGSLLHDIIAALDYRNCRVVWPSSRSDSLCTDTLNDANLLNLLCQAINESQCPSIIGWGATQPFYSLLDGLIQRRLCFRAPELPKKAEFWTAMYLESKAGARELLSNLRRTRPDVRLPEGFTCDNEEVASRAIAYFTTSGRGCVLKANYGTGGFSTLGYPVSLLQRGSESLCRDARHRMAFDHYWSSPPVIIEEYIAPPTASTSLTPTIDLRIAPGGSVEVIGVGSMVMRRGFLYSGIRCGLGCLPTDLETNMRQIGLAIGEAISAIGYRGWFDVDFVQGVDGGLYVTEINARRASPTHVFSIAEQLFGGDWPYRCSVFANDHVQLQGSRQPQYALIRQIVNHFNDEYKTAGVIVLVTIASSSLARSAPYFGYVLLAANSEDAVSYGTCFENNVKQAIGMNTRN